MAIPAYDGSFVEELGADVEAYLQRCSVLTDFAEIQVEERVRLARIVNQLAAERDTLQLTVSELERQIDSLGVPLHVRLRSKAARLKRAPRKLWRVVRRSRPR